MISRITSFANTPCGRRPVTRMRRTFSGSMARHCEARTSRTWEVPIPNAMAPNAPCVEVWLSPQAMVMPGCVSPSSGPITWTIPWRSARQVEERHARLAAVSLERRQHVLGHHVLERPPLVARRDDVIDRGDGSLGEPHAPAARSKHVEGLRARDLVHQVQPDEELGLPVRQPAHAVRIPDFLKQGRGHFVMVRRSRLAARRPGLVGRVRGSRFAAYGRALALSGAACQRQSILRRTCAFRHSKAWAESASDG